MPVLTKILEYLVLCCKNTKFHSECCSDEEIKNNGNEKIVKKGCLLDIGGRSKKSSPEPSPTQTQFSNSPQGIPLPIRRISL